MSSNDTGARYGAAGCEAEITRHFVSRGAVLRSRRQNIVFISVAALSCTCAVLFVLTQTRSSELLSPWLSNEAPVATNNYAWNGLKDYHAALSKGLAGDVGETPIQGSAAKEVEDDPDRLLSTLGPDGLAAYNDAMASASESHQDLGSLVQHYQNLDANSGAPSSVSEAFENLQAAHEMWQSRHKILERLDNEIQHERARIHALEDDEQNLLRHHERAASYVGSLLTASKNIGMQLKELRAYYEEQLEKSTEQYEDAAYEHKLMTEKMKQRLLESQERADDYNSQVSKSIAQASYYDGQVEIAKAQEREMRSRASTARTEAQSSKATLGVALTKALDEKVRERQAQALQKDAELKANAVTTVTRQKSEANEDLYEAKAKLIEAEAIAKADMSAAEDAKKRVDDGKEEERRAKTRLRLMQEELHEVMDMIINEQTKAKTAEVRAALYQSRTAAAQAALEDELAKQEAMAGQVKDAVLMVEQAEGQAALAKTEATLTEQSAREAMADSKEKVVMAQRAVEESKAHTQQVKAALEEVARRRQAAIEDVVDKQASVTDAQNVLTLAQERNELAKAYAEEMGSEVDQKKADAEALLNTVRELTAAARDTAALAREARARVPPPKPAPLFIGVPHNMPLPAI